MFFYPNAPTINIVQTFELDYEYIFEKIPCIPLKFYLIPSIPLNFPYFLVYLQILILIPCVPLPSVDRLFSIKMTILTLDEQRNS